MSNRMGVGVIGWEGEVEGFDGGRPSHTCLSAEGRREGEQSVPCGE